MASNPDWELVARLEQWQEVVDCATYYELLGVLPITDDASLKEAYHAFALAFHPDRQGELAPETRDPLSRIFQLGTEAYRVLSRPELRLRYDMLLEQGVLRLPPEELSSPPTAPSTTPVELETLARSAGAKLATQRAGRLIEQGQLRGAVEALRSAIEYDGANPALARRLEDLELALFATGG